MTTASKVVRETISQLKACATIERAQQGASYHPTQMRILGTTVPEVKKVVAQLHRTYKNDPEMIVSLSEALIHSGCFEARHAGQELLARHPKIIADLTGAFVESLGQGNDNWVSVDVYAAKITGVAWRTGHIDDKRVARWVRSPDRWWRRTALVSTLGWNQKARGGQGDSQRTFAVCQPLVADHDDMVVKGLSWALRELIIWDAKGVQRFLATHEDVLAKRVLREVGNKLKTGHKNPKK